MMVMLAAVGLVLVTVFALSARMWWAFDLFSHFRLQYTIAALLLGIAALALRNYPAAALLAAVVLVHSWAIKDLWLGGTARAASGGAPLRVVSINALADNPMPGEVLEFVRASDADLVVLVDAKGKRWRHVLSEIGTLYEHRAPQSWREGAPVLLFSRFRILAEKVVRPPGGRRPYLMAEVRVAEQPLMIVGVHPSSPSPSRPGHSHRRNRELNHVADVVEGSKRPVIVAGDFNTTAWSPHFEDLVAAGGLRSAADGQGYVATWPRWFWPAQIPIDHVLFKGPLAATTLRRGPAVGSDHYPLIADLRLLLPGPPA